MTVLLAIDTATRWASLALYDGSGIISEFSWRCAGSHTVEVLPNIAFMLEQAQKRASDLRAVAVARGPGSFTGLRIGMGVAKGLCLAVGIPIIAIPTQEIMAYAAGDPGGLVYTVLELGRGRIAVGAYQYENGFPVMVQEDAIYDGQTWQPDASKPILVTGEVGTELAERLLRIPEAENIAISSLASSIRRAGYMAELAWLRLEGGHYDDLDSVDPVYLHLPGSGTPNKA